MDVQAISTAIVNALKNIQVGSQKINTYDYGSDSPDSPAVYVYPSTEDFGTTVSVDSPKFVIRFLIASTETRSGQAALNTLISTGVTGSAIDAIRAGNTLGNVVQSARVETMRNYGVREFPPNQRYFSAELVLDVLAK